MTRNPPIGPFLASMSSLTISEESLTAPSENSLSHSSSAEAGSSTTVPMELDSPTIPSKPVEAPDKASFGVRITKVNTTSISHHAQATATACQIANGHPCATNALPATTSTSIKSRPIIPHADFMAAVNNLRSPKPIIARTCQHCRSEIHPRYSTAKLCRRCAKKILRSKDQAPFADPFLDDPSPIN